MDSTRTVVVPATEPGIDVERMLRRLRRDRSNMIDVVVVTDRNLHLPASLGRHVRVVRCRTAEAALDTVAEMVAEGAEVVRSGRPAPRGETIGACFIVKDEEEVLAASLLAVVPFVDEVLVYDTGSSDRTVEVARACGARVVQGYWDDHFGHARDRAMAHLTTGWMFTVDADEIVEGDPAELRRRLAGERADVVMVPIVSTSWSGADDGETIVSPRLSRRDRVRWEGSIHEHLVPHQGAAALVAGPGLAPLRLVHSGYQTNVVSEKDKPLRNLALAEKAWEEIPPDAPGFYETLANYGRSLHLAGRDDEAVTALDPLRTVDGAALVVLTPGRLCVTILLRAGRFDEAEAWVDALERNQESGRAVALQRARVALALGDLGRARHQVDRAGAERWDGGGDADADAWGLPFSPSDVLAVSASIHLAENRPADALEQLCAQMRDDPAGTSLPQLLTALERSGAEWVPVLRQAPRQFLDGSLRAVIGVEPAASGLRWCEAFSQAWPEDRGPLVAGCFIAARCDLATSLTWSVTAREAGLPQLCPVRRAAEQADRSAADRTLLWALLADSFGEFDARARFTDTMAEVSPVDLPDLRSSLGYLAPALVSTVVEVR